MAAETSELTKKNIKSKIVLMRKYNNEPTLKKKKKLKSFLKTEKISNVALAEFAFLS